MKWNKPENAKNQAFSPNPVTGRRHQQFQLKENVKIKNSEKKKKKRKTVACVILVLQHLEMFPARENESVSEECWVFGPNTHIGK